MADEGFIHFIWKHSLLGGRTFWTCCGQKLEVLLPGEQNSHGGPDFLNARIRIDRLTWAGNVEIHSRASDWYRHQHHLDPAYNNVILHVVGNFDTDVYNSLGRRIQTLLPEFPKKLYQRYEILKRNDAWMACAEYLASSSIKGMKPWLYALHVERTSQKCRQMKQILYEAGTDLDGALYRVLAHGFGIPLNTYPFGLLAKKVPLQYLTEYLHNLSDLEAILFAQSGLLSPARSRGAYPDSLWHRFTELNRHNEAGTVPAHLWRFFRLRPPSFPTIRISQFASLIHQRSPLAESILGKTTIGEMEQIFSVCASEYWTNHYLFGKASTPFPKKTGIQFVRILIINVLVPFLSALDDVKGRSDFHLAADGILQNLKAENNQIIKNWSIFGIGANNAMESQALLQLYHFYCKQKRCLECHIGTEIVRDALRQ